MDVNDLIGILVEQNKSFIEQNKNYKDMLQLAVGSIITVLVIFLTANFFTMRKIRQDEIEKIKTDIIQDIKINSLPEIKEEFNKSIDSSITSKLAGLKQKVVKLEAGEKGFEKELYRIEAEILKLEGDFYFQGESYSNAFQHYLRSGNLYLKAEKFGYVDSTLRSLEKAAVKMHHVLGDLAEFTKFSSQLSSEYQTQVSKITDILKTKESL